jgi:hypothetical protein
MRAAAIPALLDGYTSVIATGFAGLRLDFGVMAAMFAVGSLEMGGGWMNTQAMATEVLTTKQIALRWGVRDLTVHVLAKQGRLAGIKADDGSYRVSLDEVLRYEANPQNDINRMLQRERESLAMALRVPNRAKRLMALNHWIDRTGCILRDRFGLRFPDGTRCKYATVMAPRLSAVCGCHISQRLCSDWMQSEWPGFLPLEAFEPKADSAATKAI